MTPDTVRRADPSSFDWAHSSDAQVVRSVATAAEAADGRSPLNEAALLHLRHRGLEDAVLWLAGDGAGLAFASPVGTTDGPEEPSVDLELVVAPDHRGHGVGAALARVALDELGSRPVTLWSHGNHPAANRLAERFGFRKTRDLWVMRRPLATPLPELASPEGFEVRTFRPGDEDALLSVNAAAFAEHPEQGRMTRADLDARMAEQWFDPEGLLLAVDGDDLLGFHWTKEQSATVGEVYVVGMAPAAQGRGVGKHLTLAGLHHLEKRGLDEVILFVEGDNAPAIAVYSGLGFSHDPRDTDVQYARG